MKGLLLLIILSISLWSNAQNVYIPDLIFKNYLVGNPLINTNGDQEIQISEANSFSGEIDLFDTWVQDLTGLEEFTQVTSIDCRMCTLLNSIDITNCSSLESISLTSSNISTLDVSQNFNLEILGIRLTNISTLDISQNINLRHLDAGQTNITTIDLSQNALLEVLHLDSNPSLNDPLISIDVSNLPNLSWINLTGAIITSLDLSNNPSIALINLANCFNLKCLNLKNGTAFPDPFTTGLQDIILNGCSALECVEVDDTSTDGIMWTVHSPNASLSNSCYNSCLGSLDIKELTSENKEVVKIVNLLGQEVEFQPNTVLIYIYSDGTSEKVFTVE